MSNAISDFFVHFEPKDWVTMGTAGAALLVSGWAALHNREANQMKRLDRQAYFKASWWITEKPPTTYLVLENVGDAFATDIKARFDFDPTSILGPTGYVNGRMGNGDIARLSMSGSDPRHRPSAAVDQSSILIIEWTDHYDRIRRQRISYTEIYVRPCDDPQASESRLSIPHGQRHGLPDPTIGRERLKDGRKWPHQRRKMIWTLRELLDQDSTR